MALLLIACLPPKMLNVSIFPWNKYDYNILNQAKIRCGKIYPDSPCVKLFKKYNKQQYSVICGKK